MLFYGMQGKFIDWMYICCVYGWKQCLNEGESLSSMEFAMSRHWLRHSASTRLLVHICYFSHAGLGIEQSSKNFLVAIDLVFVVSIDQLTRSPVNRRLVLGRETRSKLLWTKHLGFFRPFARQSSDSRLVRKKLSKITFLRLGMRSRHRWLCRSWSLSITLTDRCNPRLLLFEWSPAFP